MGPYGFSLIYANPNTSWGENDPLEEHDRKRAGADDGIQWDSIGAMVNDPNSTTELGYPTQFQEGARRLDAGGGINPVRMNIDS